RAAPCSPEVEKDDLSSVVRQPVCVSILIGQFKVKCRSPPVSASVFLTGIRLCAGRIVCILLCAVCICIRILLRTASVCVLLFRVFRFLSAARVRNRALLHGRKISCDIVHRPGNHQKSHEYHEHSSCLDRISDCISVLSEKSQHLCGKEPCRQERKYESQCIYSD